MPFKPGQSGNPNGRPKGSKNQFTKESKDILDKAIAHNLKYVQKALEKVLKENPAKGLDLISKLSEYLLPKLSRQEVKHEGDNLNPITIMKTYDKKCDCDGQCDESCDCVCHTNK